MYNFFNNIKYLNKYNNIKEVSDVKNFKRLAGLGLSLVIILGVFGYAQIRSYAVQYGRLEFHQSDLRNLYENDTNITRDIEIPCAVNTGGGKITILAGPEESGEHMVIRKNGQIRTRGEGVKTADGWKRAVRIDIPEGAMRAEISVSAKSGGSDDRYIAISDGETVLNGLGTGVEGSASDQMTDIAAKSTSQTVKSELIYGEGTFYLYSTFKSIDISDIEVTWVSDSGATLPSDTDTHTLSLTSFDMMKHAGTWTESVPGLGTTGAFTVLAEPDHEIQITGDGQLRTRYTGNTGRNSVMFSVPPDAKDAEITVTASSSGDTEKYIFISDGQNELNADPTNNKISDMAAPPKDEGTKAISSSAVLEPGTYYIYSKNGGCYIDSIVVSW